MTETEARLRPDTAKMLSSSDVERIAWIRQSPAVFYPELRHVLTILRNKVECPVDPTKHLYLAAPSGNGKTFTLALVAERFPADDNATGFAVRVPVLRVDLPTNCDLRQFYIDILESFADKYRTTWTQTDLRATAIKRMREAGTKLLMIDEAHDMLDTTLLRRRAFLLEIKRLGNLGLFTIVLAGLPQLLTRLQLDNQYRRRFPPLVLPPWQNDDRSRSLLATIETTLPLREPSGLGHELVTGFIVGRGESAIEDIVDFVRVAAIDAIETGAERITLKRLKRLKWIGPAAQRRVAAEQLKLDLKIFPNARL